MCPKMQWSRTRRTDAKKQEQNKTQARAGHHEHVGAILDKISAVVVSMVCDMDSIDIAAVFTVVADHVRTPLCEVICVKGNNRNAGEVQPRW